MKGKKNRKKAKLAGASQAHNSRKSSKLGQLITEPLPPVPTRPAERRLSLRIPPDLAERVKRAAQARLVHTPVHSWLVEAILEKLAKESF